MFEYLFETELGILFLFFYCRYEAVYAKKLPECITGETFVKKYTNHSDTVTVIDPRRTYVVKAPTKHPIYENFRVEVGSFFFRKLHKTFPCICKYIY